jgi:hypothetical protein
MSIPIRKGNKIRTEPNFRVLMLCLTMAVCIVTVVAVPRIATAAATITVVNGDGAGEGFNDPTVVAPVGNNPGTTLGAQRLNAFQFAANLWGAAINSNVQIFIIAFFDVLDCDANSVILGQAGTTTIHRGFTGAPVTNTWYPQALANSLFGADLSPPSNPPELGDFDIFAQFNSTLGTTCAFPFPWYYGLDGNPPANTIDFVTVVLHEIAHGLGFQTLVDLATGEKFDGFNDTYMRHLEHHGAVPSDYPSMSNAQRITASQADPNLHWTGPWVALGRNALTSGVANGHVRMHGPSPQQQGSSVSHFSTSLFFNQLMEPSFTTITRDLAMTRLLFRDIGWSVDFILHGFWTKVKEGCTLTACFAKGKFVVRNDGGNTAAAGKLLRFYHSGNSTFGDNDDNLIQTITLGSLGPGASQSTKFKGQTAMSGNPAGGRIFAVIDEGGLVNVVISPSL